MNDATQADMLKWTRATCIAVVCLAIAVTAQAVYTDLVDRKERSSTAAVQAKCEAALTAMHNEAVRAQKRALHQRIAKGQNGPARRGVDRGAMNSLSTVRRHSSPGLRLGVLFALTSCSGVRGAERWRIGTTRKHS